MDLRKKRQLLRLLLLYKGDVLSLDVRDKGHFPFTSYITFRQQEQRCSVGYKRQLNDLYSVYIDPGDNKMINRNQLYSIYKNMLSNFYKYLKSNGFKIKKFNDRNGSFILTDMDEERALKLDSAIYLFFSLRVNISFNTEFNLW